MDARIKGICLACLALCSVAATDRSRNFVVTAPTPEIARQIVQQAEIFRHKLAVEWLGKPLPTWRYPCTVNVTVGQIGAGGATTFVFRGDTVGDFKMNIQGPLDRILDSVLPHEINHTIFAEHFRRPMPRWADEGAATFVEDESERRRQMLLAMQVLKTNRRIPLRSLLGIMDYPKDMQDVLHLYAEGYVLVELLIQSGGRGKFLNFLKSANTDGWDRALYDHYGHRGVDFLEKDWNQWVLAGCPARTATPPGTLYAAASPQGADQAAPVLARSQAPDRESVTVEDAAHADDLVAAVGPSSKRGQGLQAPVPTRRSAAHEPAMLNQVELGSGVPFDPSRSRQVASRSASGRSRAVPPTQNPTARLVAENDSEYAQTEYVDEIADEEPVAAEMESVEQEFEGFEPEMIVRPSRPSRPVAPARTGAPRSSGPRMMTPALRFDSRPQYGQARPFPKDEA